MSHDASHSPMRQLERTSRLLLVLTATIALLFTPLAPSAATQDDEPLNVVVSFSVLADIVEQVGGGHVEVTSLVPAGGDAHTFDPSPDQIATLADADLIVEVGGDFEPWLDDLVEASGTSAARFEAFPSDHANEENEQHDEGDDHEDEELHTWLNVQSTSRAVERLSESLAEIDPGNGDDYQASADAYIAELEELDSYITEQTGTLSEDQRQLVTTHQSFGPFADAYGYEIVGVLLESHSTEGGDAPASHVAELVEIINENDIPAIFPDTPGGTETLQPLADEAGVEVAPPLYADTLGEEGSGAETYIDMMRHNIDTIVSALGE